MANVVRLVNGGTIQVRTGVIQGIGPQGPRGVAGPQGIDGAQGPVGEVGPMGQINQLQGKTTVATNNPLAANTNTVIAFGSVGYDDMSAFTSTTNTTLTAAGDYILSAYLRFNDAVAGLREVWFAVGATTLVRTSRQSVAGVPFYVDLAVAYRATAGDVVNVIARSAAATGVSEGALTVTRVGSGPIGPVGVEGPVGPVGATGAQGPPGPPGSANSGFGTYAEILPH
jgi:hypothetical protein